jgi:hypothetical protein
LNFFTIIFDERLLKQTNLLEEFIYFTFQNIFNNIFSDNKALSGIGGAIANYANITTNVNLQFNTFYNNQAVTGGALWTDMGTTTNIANDIYYGNSAVTGSQVYFESSSVVSLTYSNIASGNAGVVGFDFEAAAGNVTGNPLFTNAAAGDFTLQTISPASVRNGGTNNVSVFTDFNNTPRTVPYSMGAFEFDAIDTVSPSIYAINPTVNAINVPTNSAITIVVTDNVSVSLSSLVVTINNILAVNNGITQNGYSLTTNVTSNGYEFIISTGNHFSYGSTVTVNVKASDTSSNISFLTYAFAVESTPNLTVTQTITLVPGYNFIGFQVSMNMTASQLTALITANGGAVEIIYGPIGNENYVIYYPVFNADDFIVTPSVGVVIKSSVASTFNVNGVLLGPIVNYQLNGGYNFISLPYRSNGNEYSAIQIANQLILDGGDIDKIYGFRPDDQGYNIYYPIFGADNFIVSNNLMLVIKANTPVSSNFTVAP